MAKKKAAKKHDNVGSDEEFVFEDAMEEIEEIVVALENGKLPLAESLDRYERAVGQLKRCHTYLDRAERQVRVLAGVDEDGQPITGPLDQDDDDAGDADLIRKQSSRSRRRGAGKRSDQDGDDDAAGPGLF